MNQESCHKRIKDKIKLSFSWISISTSWYKRSLSHFISLIMLDVPWSESFKLVKFLTGSAYPRLVPMATGTVSEWLLATCCCEVTACSTALHHWLHHWVAWPSQSAQAQTGRAVHGGDPSPLGRGCSWEDVILRSLCSFPTPSQVGGVALGWKLIVQGGWLKQDSASPWRH